MYYDVQWTAQSFDVLLGIIGGFTALLWGILSSSMENYESFKFGTSLISEMYTTTARSRMQSGEEPTTHEEAKADVTKCLET